MKADILGVQYELIYCSTTHTSFDEEKGDHSYVDFVSKQIKLRDLSSLPEFANCTKSEISNLLKEKARKEVIKAYLYESGIPEGKTSFNKAADTISSWFAMQAPKIILTWKQFDLLNDGAACQIDSKAADAGKKIPSDY